MYSILVKSVLLFMLCQLLHIFIWRIKRPTAYSRWSFPTMFIIFILLGGLGAFGMVKSLTLPGDDITLPGWVEWAGIFLFQVVLSLEYMIGYTGVAAFSPSVEILKVLEHTSGGLPREKLLLPFFEDKLVDVRVDNLIATDMIAEDNGVLHLARRGRLIARALLFYRHLLGLPDEASG